MLQHPEELVCKTNLPPVETETRRLSVTSVETDFVAGVYEKIGSFYDVLFGVPLHKGRVESVERLRLSSGDRVLEIGVGTGINVSLYPRDCDVTAIDLSAAMLEKAARRVARHRLSNVSLLQMDAETLTFPDDSFDIVYAPYTISVVSDPVKVVHEMRRVCRPGGRFVFLSHFLSSNPIGARFERFISPATVHLGFKADLDLPAFLQEAGLKPDSIEKVNIPRLWSLVTCSKKS
ncbi:MAG: SAM-dependent methyltransferase [Acidobacteria bacterium]|nr:SAM-dependent methyltransferase [Acidobacteriota bacterium]|tara:strand:- start:6046 stop:6747 length:702 start_codon:yes stop_codon:yes gene_type:complete